MFSIARTFNNGSRDLRATRARRNNRTFLPGDAATMELAQRLLTVPVFSLTPNLAQAQNEATSESDVASAIAGVPGNASDDETGVLEGGVSAFSSITNNFIYNVQQNDDGSSSVTNVVTVGEQGEAIMSVALPTTTTGSGSSISQVQFQANLSNLDTVQTDANGPYGIANNAFVGGGEHTSANGGFNLTIANPDGSPATGSVTVSFTSTMLADDPRFIEVGEVNINSPYFNIVANRTNNTVQVTSPDFGTVLASGDLHNFAYSNTFPITGGNIPVFYNTDLYSGPNGQFGGSPGAPASEFASHAAALDWGFVLTAHNP
jgi:hypothetical protein